MARNYHIYEPRRRRSASVLLRLLPPDSESQVERPPSERPVPRLELVPSLPVEVREVAVTPIEAPPRTLTAELEQAIVAVLTAGPQPGETTSVAFQRKERELATRFAALTVVQAMELHDRLANPHEDDVLARQFQRLVVDRRARLLAFLADARRREAIASVRAGVA